MDEPAAKFSTVDEYIEAATYDVEPRLVETRRILREVLSDAEECISYNIPAYKRDGVVVMQFAGYAEHTSLNFYPSGATFAHFADQLSEFRTTKSAIRFPLSTPLPVELISDIAAFRREEAAAFVAHKRSGR